MATYEYVCMACERGFEATRPMGASVATDLACPSCGSERVRRRFSFVAATQRGGSVAPSAGGCGCGGACACGRHG